MKTCNKCKISKELDEFPSYFDSRYRHTGRLYYQPTCKKCQREIQREYRKQEDYSERMKYHMIKHTYGLTRSEYDEMLLDQDYACLICDIVFDSGGHATKCCVDHDHTTGKVRGLICHDCNVGLSRFKDDPEILRNAIKYLKKWGSK